MFTFASLLALALAGQSLAKAPYCLPGDATCFPSTEELSRFNVSIGGKLLAPPPYGRVCYADHFDAAACAELVANKGNGTYREAIPAAMMYTNMEFTSNGTGCPVPAAAPEKGLDGSCELGALGSYFVQATSADDISQAVKFAAKHNLRLRVKNTGHDYTGRSTDAGSFVILTQAFQEVELKSDFVPTGCSSSRSQDVLRLGAGVVAQDLYAEAAKLGVVTTGGFCPTVGIAGGFALGGGAAGPFQPVIGMGADNVVQYDIVTVDGTITVANECENKDLFWAMRGGGGVFAVSTATYVKAHPAFKAVNVVAGQVSAANEKAYRNLISEFVQRDPEYASGFSSGIWETTYPNLTIVFQKGFQANETLVSGEKSASAFDFLNSLDDVTVSLQGLQFESWSQAFEAVVGPIMEEGSAVGVNILDISRVVSNDMLGSKDGRQSIAEFVTVSHEAPYHDNGSSDMDFLQTSVNPAFRKSAAYFDIPVFASSTGGTTSVQQSTAQSLMPQADQVFGRDAYYNEGNRLESDYQERFWGSNYEALLSLKKKIDPNCVLTGALTVGETEICGSR
ncbi:FAD-binding domain-containing protein [Aspergillus steynii IBT 23096]|uniref:FAD-binding domain-containing protein n=1 Tax=Aspergillus steynii IBT 23096 TaxID=1392250 RepID=A0A2I2GL25_9EURO|nr:FAD-binding domain-containing protein [Aspergillus steynii IBT 23096]PLB53578.1 FAD-binding domain-containing protein [Aspergillus steynii IBT 23096]